MTQPASPVTRLTANTRTNLNGILKGDGTALGTVAVGSNLSYDGTTLSAANQTTAPGGSSGQIQYNSGGAFAGAAALTYATSGTHLTATAQGGTVVPLAAQMANGQTANAVEVRDYLGNVRGGWGPQSTVTDSLALFLRPSNRSYYVGTDEAAGSMVFARSDSANGLTFIPNPGNVVLRASDISSDFLLELPNGNNLVLCPNAAGATDKKVQFGRRYSDSSSTVGCGVECWPKTGQTIPALAVMAPGGASANWAIGPGGEFRTALAAAATTLGSVVKKLAVQDTAGTVLGYLPLYDSIT